MMWIIQRHHIGYCLGSGQGHPRIGKSSERKYGSLVICTAAKEKELHHLHCPGTNLKPNCQHNLTNISNCLSDTLAAVHQPQNNTAAVQWSCPVDYF